MNLLWLLEQDLDLLCFMDATEVAALRALCKIAHDLVADAPEDAFDFTFSPIIPLLPKFDRYQELEWVILRLGENINLVQKRPSPQRHLRVLNSGWRYIGLDLTPETRMLHRRSLLQDLIRAFWIHPHVNALLALAIRLDSASLLRRLAAEAPGDYFSDDDNPNNNGTANFFYQVWVLIEEDHHRIHGQWEPTGRDDAIVGSDLFFSTLHFVLWTYMSGVRKRQRRNFNGYCRHYDFVMPGLICDARCPREDY
jgi:hypothetical protein